MKTLYSFIVEKLKIHKNSQGENVPDICPKCGGEVGVFLRGEPVFLCKKCNMYFGVVQFTGESKSEDWIDDVETRWKPKEGLFTWNDPKKIADYLLSNSKDSTQAMRRLVFYMNRAGEDCPNKTVLDQAKQIIKDKR